MKRIIMLIAAMLAVTTLALTGACNCRKNPADSSSPVDSSSGGGTVDPVEIVFYLVESVTVSEYDGVTLGYTLSGANDEDIIWSSSDEKIAAVTAGRVVGVKQGLAVITAKVGDIERTCNVTVTRNLSYPVMILSQTDAMPRVGGSVKVTAVIRFNGEEKEFSDFKWTSADNGIATCENGEIKGVSKGTTVITVSATYNGIYLEETITVTVSAE